jgi:protein required for attachment to host cells
MESQRRAVVLDGSNIVASGEEHDNDGRILLSAIEFYESLGYTVIPVMAGGTLGYMKKNKHPGVKTLVTMARNKEIRTFSDGDDEGFIQIALRRDGWIVTYDTFSHGKKDKEGNKIPSEREKYPDWDWDDIDERTRGTEKLSDGRVFSHKHWKVDGTDFHDPSMPKAPKQLLPDEYAEFRRDLQEVRRRTSRITTFLEEAEPGELTKLMLSKVSGIHSEFAKVMKMIPASQLPDDAAVDKLLVAECKQLIKLFNDTDEEANLTLSGNRGELRARIKEYAVKARGQRRQAEAERESHLKAKREKSEAKNQRWHDREKEKAENREAKEAKRKILKEKSADEISSIVISAFKEILGDEFKGDLSVSLDIENLEINCEIPSSLSKKRKRILIGKGASTIKQVVMQTSEKLGINWIRINIVKLKPL